MKISTRILALLLLPLAGVSQAAVILDQDFESFSAGDVAGQGNWTFTDVAVDSNDSNHVIETSGGLSYSSGSVNHSGGSNFLRTDGPGEDFASVTFASQDADAIYLSFLAENVGDRFHTLGLSDSVPTSTTGFPMGGSQFNGANAWARIGSDVFGSSDDRQGTLEHNGDLVLYVGKLFKSTPGPTENYDSFSYLLNPTTLTEPTSWHATAVSDTGFASVDTLLLRGAAESSTDFKMDMIRVGDTYDAVVVPEPGNFALISALFLGAVAVARRRR